MTRSDAPFPGEASARKTALSRRGFLRGLGTTLALPFLESIAPARVLASGAKALADSPPLRLAFFYVPNGIHMPQWTPSQTGASYELPPILEPLAPLRNDFQVLSGLTCNTARANDDGGGDHARSASSFLSCAQAFKTHGTGVRVGTSVDQLAAAHLGNYTRLPSLQLTTETGRQTGSCDTGYSCAYTHHISWLSESAPAPTELDPRVVFERLFGSGNADEEAQSVFLRSRYRKSVLDFVLSDAQRLEPRLGRQDRRKLDEYFSSVREIERRMVVAERRQDLPAPTPPPGADQKPKGIPADYQAHLQLLQDMSVLAFQGDVTRIATLMYARAGSNRSYGCIGVPQAHHSLSHHGGDEKKQAKIARINRYHVEQFKAFLLRLKAIPEGEGTLLDHSMIVYGSAISDGNRHTHDDLPILLAGGGGGSLDSGRHVRYPKETPLANLYTGLLQRVGVQTDRFADSTGTLQGI